MSVNHGQLASKQNKLLEITEMWVYRQMLKIHSRRTRVICRKCFETIFHMKITYHKDQKELVIFEFPHYENNQIWNLWLSERSIENEVHKVSVNILSNVFFSWKRKVSLHVLIHAVTDRRVRRQGAWWSWTDTRAIGANRWNTDNRGMDDNCGCPRPAPIELLY